MALATIPFLHLPAFYESFLYLVFHWIVLATSWNILSGYSGYFSFGHGAFYGTGVYTTAVLADPPPAATRAAAPPPPAAGPAPACLRPLSPSRDPAPPAGRAYRGGAALAIIHVVKNQNFSVKRTTGLRIS